MTQQSEATMAPTGPHAPDDPTVTDPEHYRVVLENDRVRVLEYRDVPGARTHPHRHPDSVMVTATGFRRRITSGERAVEVELEPGQVRWLAEQEHVGENVGTSPTHAFFVELKEPHPGGAADRADGPPAPLGPA
ncbi:cytoplasmic protein [Cellulomonas soli]|uniref:cytoplasmic protein n=1 Tax=Cellulomonas soli TaxID=931535 RepID=UPI003F828CA1